MINAKSEMHNCRCYYLIRKAKRFFRLLFLFLENKRIFDEYNKISFMEIAIIIVESIITLAIYWFSGILKLSMMPYNWGSRDGSGGLLWISTVIPFFLIFDHTNDCSIYKTKSKNTFDWFDCSILLKLVCPILLCQF